MSELQPRKPRLSLGATIRRGREQCGLSRRTLARRVGKDVAYISRLETDHYKRPSLDVLRRIAAEIKVSFALLASRSGHELPSDVPALVDSIAHKYGLSEAAAQRLATQFQAVLANELAANAQKETDQRNL